MIPPPGCVPDPHIQRSRTGVAYWAHIGGFVAGAVITLLARPFLDREASAASRFSTPY